MRVGSDFIQLQCDQDFFIERCDQHGHCEPGPPLSTDRGGCPNLAVTDGHLVAWNRETIEMLTPRATEWTQIERPQGSMDADYDFTTVDEFIVFSRRGLVFDVNRARWSEITGSWGDGFAIGHYVVAETSLGTLSVLDPAEATWQRIGELPEERSGYVLHPHPRGVMMVGGQLRSNTTGCGSTGICWCARRSTPVIEFPAKFLPQR
ncbi:MAG: hypothetical protein AB1Z98_40360 [Nannocystaceae bacterium]